jgi:hypothetical protein
MLIDTLMAVWNLIGRRTIVKILAVSGVIGISAVIMMAVIGLPAFSHQSLSKPQPAAMHKFDNNQIFTVAHADGVAIATATAITTPTVEIITPPPPPPMAPAHVLPVAPLIPSGAAATVSRPVAHPCVSQMIPERVRHTVVPSPTMPPLPTTTAVSTSDPAMGIYFVTPTVVAIPTIVVIPTATIPPTPVGTITPMEITTPVETVMPVVTPTGMITPTPTLTSVVPNSVLKSYMMQGEYGAKQMVRSEHSLVHNQIAQKTGESMMSCPGR